jgi:hypothetical protein
LDESPSALRRYILGLTTVAFLVVVLPPALGIAGDLASRPALAVLLAAAAILAQRFPVHLTRNSTVYVDATVLTALVLLVPPATAAVTAACAVLAHNVLRHADWDEVAFNTAQTALSVWVGSAVFGALDALGVLPEIPGIGSPVAVLAAAAAMHMLNTATVAGAVALEIGQSPVAVWRGDLRLDVPRHVALVLLGVVLASLIAETPWLTPIVVPALSLVYLSLRRSAEVRAAAEATTEAAGDIVDLLTCAPDGHSRRVAAWTRRLGQRVGLSAAAAAAAVRAAHLHGIAPGAMTGHPSDVRLRIGTVAPARRGPGMGWTRTALGREPDAAAIARHLRERWDGTGLPDALAGDDIPIGARLVAVADALDRLATPCAPASCPDLTHALAALGNGAGRIWDPRIVDALGALVAEGARTPSDPPAGGTA